ncbi:MAG: hypothetical protein ACPLRM_07280, partial [Anaerolineae bacterium]
AAVGTGRPRGRRYFRLRSQRGGTGAMMLAMALSFLLLCYVALRCFVHILSGPGGPGFVRSVEPMVSCPKCGGTTLRVWWTEYHRYGPDGRIVDWARRPVNPRVRCDDCLYSGNLGEFVAYGIDPLDLGMFVRRDEGYGKKDLVFPYRCPDCGSRAVRISWEVRGNWENGKVYRSGAYWYRRAESWSPRTKGECMNCGRTGLGSEFAQNKGICVRADDFFHAHPILSPEVTAKYFPEYKGVMVERGWLSA